MSENKHVETIVHALIATGILMIISLPATYLACRRWSCIDDIYWLVMLAIIFFVLGRVGLDYRAKALRTIRGRTVAKPMLPSVYGFQLPSIFPNFNPEKVNMLDEATRGWRVPFDDGTKVNVYRRTLYSWLIEAYTRQPRLSGKQSAISRRSNLKLELTQYQARIWLIDKAGAVIRNSTAANSTPFLKNYSGMDPPGAAWFIIEEIEERYEPSIMIF